MPIHLLTVEHAEEVQDGIRLSPGVPFDEPRPEVMSMIQGCSIQLRLPDKSVVNTELVTYGVPVTLEDGHYVMRGQPHIHLTLPADITLESVPVGTEVWLP